MKGMATAAEAENLLGITRLRKVAPHVRPDLHARPTTTSAAPSSRRSSAPVNRTAAGYDAENSSAVRRGERPWVLPGRRSSSRQTRR